MYGLRLTDGVTKPELLPQAIRTITPIDVHNTASLHGSPHATYSISLDTPLLYGPTIVIAEYDVPQQTHGQPINPYPSDPPAATRAWHTFRCVGRLAPGKTTCLLYTSDAADE